MRILQINNYGTVVGGADAVFLNTVNLLKKFDHEVIPFTSMPADSSIKDFEEYFIPSTHSYSFHKLRKLIGLLERNYSLRAKKALKKIILKHKPEIAHLHNIHGVITLSILPLLSKHNIPTVATIHGFKNLCPVFTFLNKKLEICEKCAGKNYYYCLKNNCSGDGYRKSFMLMIDSYLRDIFIPYEKFVDQFIFVSEFSKQKYLEYRSEITDKSNVIYNFVDQPQNQEGKKNYYLFIGRLDKEKGLLTLINSFKSLPNEKLIIVGIGSLLNILQNIKSDNVELVGYKSGIVLQKLISQAKFLILPSECYENNPMVILESFSMKTPVIGSNIGGIPELVKDKWNGYLFQSKNSQHLTEIIKMCGLLQHNDYENLCNNAYDFSKRYFSSEIHYSKLKKVYEKALNNKKV